MAVTCSVLYVAEELRKNRFSGRISRFIFAFSACCLDSGDIYGVSLRGFGISNIFFVKVNSSLVVTFVFVSVCQQRQVCTVQTVQKVGDSSVPFAFRECGGPDVPKTVVSHICSFRPVGGMPVVVNDRCLEVPQVLFLRFDDTVITQRQVWISRTVSGSSQIQFIAPFEDIPVAQQRLVRTVQPMQGLPVMAGLVAALRGSLLQFCSIFRPPSIRTLRPRVAGTPGVCVLPHQSGASCDGSSDLPLTTHVRTPHPLSPSFSLLPLPFLLPSSPPSPPPPPPPSGAVLLESTSC